MKIAVITDVHANLPALQAALQAIRHEGSDLIVHTGDTIGIGPFPAETLALLLNTPQLHFVMGNHDAWFAEGLPRPQPAWMSDGEWQHHEWTHKQIDAGLRGVVAQWPYQTQQEFEGVKFTFVHYGLDATGRAFAPILAQPSITDLDALFAPFTTDLVFYGHHHPFADQQGRARYINPGSLGCYTTALARYTIVECQQGRYTVEHRQASYDDGALLRVFEQRQVPERSLIYRAFFGGRFQG